MKKAEKRILTVQEVAEMLGISRPTVMKLIDTDQIPHLESDGRYIIARHAIENWIETGSFDGKQTPVVDVEEIASAVVRLVAKSQLAEAQARLEAVDPQERFIPIRR